MDEISRSYDSSADDDSISSLELNTRDEELEKQKKRKLHLRYSSKNSRVKRIRSSNENEDMEIATRKMVTYNDEDFKQKNISLQPQDCGLQCKDMSEDCVKHIHHTKSLNICTVTNGWTPRAKSPLLQDSEVSLIQKREYNRIPVNGHPFIQCFGIKNHQKPRRKGQSPIASKSQCLTSCKSCATHTFLKLTHEEMTEMANYVGMDCEFVGIGPRKTNALGRCSIVDHAGQVIFDHFVKPEEPVTDYRTPWSGLRPLNIQNGIPFLAAREQIAAILKNKVVVGHAIHNDFKVLRLSHPPDMIRDTISCKELREMAELGSNSCGLRKLTQALLGRTIQVGEHCSITDARAAMDLFRLVRTVWEPKLKVKFNQRQARKNHQADQNDDILLNSYLDDHYWPPELFVE
ncbi:hypothetical protein C0Q70_03277 [Pomacea canaliculata]|uniref:RNA exonuclease 4 n=2 Tax=Pomacea canaliculata TaxID=400727 RepID=A0A2T7PSA3_POMCA|nr:hypothetical protein C0Q70_03277 [Pomacea canaliculata]